jgi:hypothetical protein
MRLFDDFTELEHGAVQKLELELQAGSSKRTKWSTGQVIWDTSVKVIQMIKMPFGRQNPGHVEQGSEQMGLPSYITPAAAMEQHAESELPDYQSPRLLLCVDKGSSNTTLYQPELNNTRQDCELFKFLQHQYFKVNKARRWLTVKSFKNLSMSRVRKLLACSRSMKASS